jgi:2-dehydropantoate 2-reductase
VTLTLEHEGRQEAHDVRLAPADAPGTPITRLIVATKAHQTLEALQPCRPFVAPGSLLLLLQNGLGSQQAAATLFTDSQVFCGVSTEGAYRRGPWHVVHAGRGRTVVGSLRAEDTPDDLVGELGNIPLALFPTSDIHTALWEKLAINAVINPLTALLRCRNGELLTLPAAVERLPRVEAEVARVLEIAGHPALARALHARVRQVIDGTRDNYSSMYQDVAAGRRTEIDFITGYLLDIGARHGLSLPEHHQLFEAISVDGSDLRQHGNSPIIPAE